MSDENSGEPPVQVAFFSRAGALLGFQCDVRSAGILRKAAEGQSPSRVATNPGLVAPPINYANNRLLLDDSPYHAACLGAKEDAIVGAGWRHTNPDNEHEAHPLDSLCEGTFLDSVVRPWCADTLLHGVGYIEVVSDDSGKVVGLHHLEVDRVTVEVEDERGSNHYQIQADGALGEASQGGILRFARFGDAERLASKFGLRRGLISEVIRAQTRKSMSRWYGYPDWLSAVPYVEVSKHLAQFKADFFVNRGVPEFMLFVTGAKLDAKDWQTIETKLKGHIGSGNSHKTMAVNIQGKDVHIQVEKLGIEGAQEDNFESLQNSLASAIVSAHRVPHHLAGVLVPGKLGASNEFSNSLLVFHILYAGPFQRLLSGLLSSTIGRRIPGLEGKLQFRTVPGQLSEMMMSAGAVGMDTLGRMRQGLPEATASGRDLSDGVRKGGVSAADLVRAAITYERGRGA